jgi:hypothetical protein
MKFKTPELMEEFYQAPAMLQVMATWFEQLCIAHFSIEPTVTRILETVPGSSGVHEAGRAIDFRDEHAGRRLFTDEQVAFLISHMNARFPGNDSKLTCIHHKFAGGPAHFHIQISSGDEYDSQLDCFTVV